MSLRLRGMRSGRLKRIALRCVAFRNLFIDYGFKYCYCDVHGRIAFSKSCEGGLSYWKGRLRDFFLNSLRAGGCKERDKPFPDVIKWVRHESPSSLPFPKSPARSSRQWPGPRHLKRLAA